MKKIIYSFVLISCVQASSTKASDASSSTDPLTAALIIGAPAVWEGIKWACNTPASDMERDEVTKYIARARPVPGDAGGPALIVVKSDVERQFVN